MRLIETKTLRLGGCKKLLYTVVVESGSKLGSSDLGDSVLTHSPMGIFITGCTINCTGPDYLRTSEKGKSLPPDRQKANNNNKKSMPGRWKVNTAQRRESTRQGSGRV